MRGVDCQGSENGKDPLAVEAVDPLVFARCEFVHRHEVDALIGELGLDVVEEKPCVAFGQCTRMLVDGPHDRPRLGTRDRGHGQSRGDAAFEAGHADHEELIEVRREDRQEVHPLQQRGFRVVRHGEHALVERQPRQFAVEVAVLWFGKVVFLPAGGDVVHQRSPCVVSAVSSACGGA